MTSFLDFTLMIDSQKIRKVKEIKYNEYSPGMFVLVPILQLTI